MKASGREIKTNTEMRGANGGGGGGGGRREGDPERQSEWEVGKKWPARCGAGREMGRLRRDRLGAQRPGRGTGGRGESLEKGRGGEEKGRGEARDPGDRGRLEGGHRG